MDEIKSLFLELANNTSKARDSLWEKVSLLKTWSERDKVIRYVLNHPEIGWSWADGPAFESLLDRHAKERAQGAERWEE